jgi:hypothetical protein
MGAVSYRRIAMAIKMASKVVTFFIVVFLIVAMAAAEAIWSEYSPDGSIQWL